MKFISDILKRNNNNFDLLRILCAIMVIFSHSYLLSNSNGLKDPLETLLPFTNMGSVAVKIFFFISGLLVTNSLITNKSTLHFLISRFFRIYPAFIFVVVFAAIVVGPIVTKLDPSSYFSDKATIHYIKDNALLQIAFLLPDVFENNIYKYSVNGSLWTIYYEAASYLFLLSCFMIFGSGNKKTSSILCIFIIVTPLMGWNKILFINSDNPDIFLMAPCFALGALLAINKDTIRVSPHLPLGMISLYFFISNELARLMLFYFSICITMLYLASLTFICKLNIKYDISYGVYLWGFLIQQVVYFYMPNLGLHMNQFLCISISIVVGFISCIFIERPSMKIGKSLSHKSLKVRYQ